MRGIIFNIILFNALIGQAQWELISQPSASVYHYRDICFVNADTGYVVGYIGMQAVMLKTENGGDDWDTTVLNGIMPFPTGSPVAVSFPSDSIGYIACAYHILKTTDFGSNWFPVDTGDVYNNLSTNGDIIFINNDTGYVGWADGGAGGLATTDGGLSWVQDVNLPGVRHFTYNDGVVMAAASQWSVLNSSTLDWSIYSVFSTGDYHYRNAIYHDGIYTLIGHRLGSGYGIYAETEDFGNSWKIRLTVAELEDIFFINDTLAHMGGGFWGTMRSYDAGLTWQATDINNLGTGVSKGLDDIWFVNDSVGYALSGDGIYKTTNGGGPSLGEVSFWEYDLGIATETSSNELKIYPNPVQNDVLFIQLNEEIKKVQIYSLDGSLVQEINQSNVYYVNISDLGAGTYIIHCTTTQDTYTKKFIKF